MFELRVSAIKTSNLVLPFIKVYRSSSHKKIHSLSSYRTSQGIVKDEDFNELWCNLVIENKKMASFLKKDDKN